MVSLILVISSEDNFLFCVCMFEENFTSHPKCFLKNLCNIIENVFCCFFVLFYFHIFCHQSQTIILWRHNKGKDFKYGVL